MGHPSLFLRAAAPSIEKTLLYYYAIICNDVNGTDDAHISAINMFYDNIIESSDASYELVSRQGHTNVDLAAMTMPEISLLLPENEHFVM